MPHSLKSVRHTDGLNDDVRLVKNNSRPPTRRFDSGPTSARSSTSPVPLTTHEPITQTKGMRKGMRADPQEYTHRHEGA